MIVVDDEIRKIMDDIDFNVRRIEALCEEVGHGAVIGSASRAWAKKDSPGGGPNFVAGWLELQAKEIRKAAKKKRRRRKS